MKKFLFICLVAFVSGLSLTSCTDEAVQPTNTGDGQSSNPLPKP